jgi:hypothetical protein
VLVAIFPELLRNGFGAIATVAFNHLQIAILIFSDNRKLSLGHDDSFHYGLVRGWHRVKSRVDFQLKPAKP